MTKADLINIIAQKVNLQNRQAETVVNLVFDMMSDTLKKDDRIEIRGFGSFVNRVYGAYEGRNPKTGEEIPITARRVVTFHASQKLKTLVEKSFNGNAALQ